MSAVRNIFVAALLAAVFAPSAAWSASLADVIDQTQPKVVKIFGAGGLRGLEAYQSGFLISDQGHVLTAWSYVLDTEYIAVILSDGRRFQAEMLGADPRLEIAVLKIDAKNLPHFALDTAVDPPLGARVLAFANLYGVAVGDEAPTVQHGRVSARTALDARRGVYKLPYTGPVYVVDAMVNNPGAPGGAVTDAQGALVGIVGKEIRSTLTNTFVNYVLPARELTASVEDILAGRKRPRSAAAEVKKPDDPLSLRLLGIVLAPEVLPKTPPFVERVLPGSPAAKSGLRPDDLVIFVNDRLVSSTKLLSDELALIDKFEKVKITVQRGQELVEVELTAR